MFDILIAIITIIATIIIKAPVLGSLEASSALRLRAERTAAAAPPLPASHGFFGLRALLKGIFIYICIQCRERERERESEGGREGGRERERE